MRFFTSSRLLAPKTGVFLASNSLIYGVDKISTGKWSPCRVVLAPMWLEKVHESHHNNQWGQTPLGLLPYPRRIFKELYPNHPDDEYMTWGQTLEMRKLAVRKLRELHEKNRIILHDCRSEDIARYEKGQLFSAEYKDGCYFFSVNGQEIFNIRKSELGMVYNYLSRPREIINPVAQKLGLCTRPHTELYYREPSLVPETLLISGAGLSSVWIRKHFPEAKLFVFSNKKNAQLPKIPSNVGVDYDSIQLFTVDDLRKDPRGFLAIQGQKQGKDGYVVRDLDPKKAFYSARGYKPYRELTDCLPKEFRLMLQDSDKPSDSWTAPKNIPAGSLTQRLMEFYLLSGMYEDYNYSYHMQYYHKDVTPVHLERKLAEKNIKLHGDFFNRLSGHIKGLKNPVDEKGELRFYIDVFKVQNPTREEESQFKSVVEEMQQEIRDRYELLHNFKHDKIQSDSDAPTKGLKP